MSFEEVFKIAKYFGHGILAYASGVACMTMDETTPLLHRAVIGSVFAGYCGVIAGFITYHGMEYYINRSDKRRYSSS